MGLKIKRSSENLGFRFSDDLVFICNFLLFYPVGEDWGEGGSTGQTNLILPKVIEP
ncbi:hypothetical protein HMPREF3156_02396, partial [Neisseria sp. HMSC06F02]